MKFRLTVDTERPRVYKVMMKKGTTGYPAIPAMQGAFDILEQAIEYRDQLRINQLGFTIYVVEILNHIMEGEN